MQINQHYLGITTPRLSQPLEKRTAAESRPPAEMMEERIGGENRQAALATLGSMEEALQAIRSVRDQLLGGSIPADLIHAKLDPSRVADLIAP